MKKSLGAKTLVYPTPAWIIAVYDQSGKPNAMTVAWAGLCCSAPPAVAVSVRQETYTYQCLLDRRSFTVNVPSEQYLKELDFMGIVSGRNTDKFSLTGLTPVKSDLVDAPYIKEFPLNLECKLLNTLEIGLHTQFIGQILDVKVGSKFLTKQGIPDLKKINPVIFANGMYYGIGETLGKAFSIGKNIAPPF